jgi:hypothetical protein
MKNQFRYENVGAGSVITTEINTDGVKDSNLSYLTFDVESMGGYPMDIVIQIDGEKKHRFANDVNKITLIIRGQYESLDLIKFLQDTGAMTKLVF